MTEHVHVWEVTETSGGTHSRCIDCRQESFGGPSTTLIPRATPPDLGPTLLALEKRVAALERRWRVDCDELNRLVDSLSDIGDELLLAADRFRYRGEEKEGGQP